MGLSKRKRNRVERELMKEIDSERESKAEGVLRLSEGGKKGEGERENESKPKVCTRRVTRRVMPSAVLRRQGPRPTQDSERRDKK